MLPPPVKIPSAFSMASHGFSNSCMPFTIMFILANAEATFEVYSSCDIPLGLAKGMNKMVLQSLK